MTTMTLERLRTAVWKAEQLELTVSELELFAKKRDTSGSTTIFASGAKLLLIVTPELAEAIKLAAWKQALQLCAQSQVAGVDVDGFRKRLMAVMESSCVSA